MAKQIPLPQEYPVPSNWKWVKMEKVIFTRSGFPFDSGKFSKEQGGRKPLIRIRDVVRGTTATYTDEECPNEYIIHRGDVLIGMDGDFNVAKWQSEDALLNQRVCYICSANDALLDEYLFYYLPDPLKKINDATPSVTVKHLSTKSLEKTPIPLPPLPEQQRIVDRIESLFAKLDKAREKARSVVDRIEKCRTAILYKALTGDLTLEWRALHGYKKQDWKRCKLSDVSRLQTGLMKGKHFSGQTVKKPYLRVANVQDGYLNLNEIKEIEVEEINISRYLLKDGDVLFTEGGDYDKLGRGTVWHEEIKDCLHQNHVFVVRPNVDVLLPDFLSFQAGSQYGKSYFLSCSKQTTNLASINSTQLKNFPVLLPPVSEQKQIISIVQNLLTMLNKSTDAAERVIEQIDTMKKAILARAFRGELGTNDPTEEKVEANTITE